MEEFSYLGKEDCYNVVVRNTNLVADWCDRINPLPKGLFAPKLEDSAGELSRLVWGKAKSLYGEEVPQIVSDRINACLLYTSVPPWGDCEEGPPGAAGGRAVQDD